MKPSARALLTSLALCLTAMPAFAQTTVTRTVSTPQPVIIDTDIGDDIDDAYAVIHALKSSAFNVLGITTAYGDTHLRARLTHRLLLDAGVTSMPVAIGIPTESKTSFTQAAYARGYNQPFEQVEAVDFLLKEARKAPGKVTLIAVGPLCNIGAAIERDPEGFRMFKDVVIMNGSVRRGYDGGDPKKHAPPSPEWNTKNDIEATRKLLNSGVPVYMMPLDSTQVRLPNALRDKLYNQDHPLAKALKQLTLQHGRKHQVLYDSVTVAFAENPAAFPLTPMHLEVTDKGFTIEKPGEKPNVFVCLETDEKAFLKTLAERLTFK